MNIASSTAASSTRVEHDAVGGLYIAHGRIAGIGRAPQGFKAERDDRRPRCSRRARAGRPVCAAARARLGRRAEGRDARGAGRRCHRRRLPARYGSAARRARAGAHAAAALARIGRCAHLSARRADASAAGRGAGRDADTGRNRLRGVHADRAACRTTTACCCRRCAMRGRSTCRCGCARWKTRSPATESPLPDPWPAGSGCRRSRSSPRPWLCTRSSNCSARPARGYTSAGCRRPPVSNWCGGPNARACR